MLTTLRQWGDEWITGKGNEPVLLEHRDLRAPRHRRTSCCDHCGEVLGGRDVARRGRARA